VSNLFLLPVDNDTIAVRTNTHIYNTANTFSDSNDIYDIDFGQYYEILDLRYFRFEKQLFILFFITETHGQYAVICSFDYAKLIEGDYKRISKSHKRKYFYSHFTLISDTLRNNILTLHFDKQTFNVDLKKDIKKEYYYKED
jgi:hypothetical protein